MGTRCYVGVTDGPSVKAIYVNFDGYPDGVGDVLLNHYQEPDKVDELVNLGNLSCLYANIGREMTKEEHHNIVMDENIDESEYQCLADIRDSGIDPDDCKPIEMSFYDFMYKIHDPMGVDWVYIYSEGIWHFAPRNVNGDKTILNWKPLIRLEQKHIDSDSYIDERLIKSA